MNSGKKTERVLMRVTADMKREVEALAQLEGRPINHQYRMLIAFALTHSRAGSVNGMKGRTSQPASTLTFAEENTKELSATSGNSALPNQLLLNGCAGPIPARKRRTA